MSGDYHRIRTLLLGVEQLRLEKIDLAVQRSDARFERLPETLAESIEVANSTRGASRLARALSESTAESLELAVQKRPGAIVQAVFPIIGPAIRRALSEALRAMAQDLDQALQETLSLRALRWRLECLRTGIPYASVALRHRLHYQVEHLFLIRRESGLLLDHLCRHDRPGVDVDAIAGMLTAIEQFVQDSVASGEEGGLGGATVGDYRLLLSHGPCLRLAAFVSGVPPSNLGRRLDELNETLHTLREQHGEEQVNLPAGALADLEELKEVDPVRRRTSGHYFVGALVASILVAMLVWSWMAVGWSRQVGTIRNDLDALPGFALLSIESEGRGALMINGLLDPAGQDPRSVLRSLHPGVRTDWRLRPYVSSDPEVVVRRARQQLALPHGVSTELDEAGTLHLRGSVPFAMWYGLDRRPPAVEGVRGLETGGLDYPGMTHVDALIGEIESIRIDFAGGVSAAVADELHLRALVASLQALQRQAHRSGLKIHVRTYGFTDEPGPLGINRQLRLRRAEWLGEAIRSRMNESIDIDVSMDTLSVRFHGRCRAANAQVMSTPLGPPNRRPD
ncbi:hypothetical protein [Montanilutibacter psychrotolerans]|uniref:OmpA family protein n=1 Tax=Montanilutibacter psychrotolerans TaxID=1327343 RepID=A0A3M8SV58_9GAMM|nr:hypothetical protein [Lysobacter psychrotolerans]RNF85228.1 hypothetical protein EER27_05510 [Lysobacter psychrotolerans]